MKLAPYSPTHAGVTLLARVGTWDAGLHGIFIARVSHSAERAVGICNIMFRGLDSVAMEIV